MQMPGSSRYENSQQEYFSLIQRDVSPACIVQPSSSEEVAGIVKVAIENDIPFAIHSGGHMWLPEASNIGGNGFTLDLVDIKTYELADDKKSVKIGSGWRWGSVFDKLAEEGLHAIGGRDKDVGVGGFLLGGEIQFTNNDRHLLLTIRSNLRRSLLPFLRTRHWIPQCYRLRGRVELRRHRSCQ